MSFEQKPSIRHKPVVRKAQSEKERRKKLRRASRAPLPPQILFVILADMNATPKFRGGGFGIFRSNTVMAKDATRMRCGEPRQTMLLFFLLALFFFIFFWGGKACDTCRVSRRQPYHCLRKSARFRSVRFGARPNFTTTHGRWSQSTRCCRPWFFFFFFFFFYAVSFRHFARPLNSNA